MSLVHLYDLQQVDTALARASAHRQSLDDGAARRASLEAAAAKAEEIHAATRADQARLKVLDLEMRSVEGKKAQMEADLYSGRVRNPKELAAMQEEIAQLARARSAIEDEALALYERAEQLEAQAREAQRVLDDNQAELDRQLAAYREASAAADREIDTLSARRAELAAGIDESLLRRYERLLVNKGGVAVVLVRDGICDGCHVGVPQRVLSRLQRDADHLVTCDGCGRILWLPYGYPS